MTKRPKLLRVQTTLFYNRSIFVHFSSYFPSGRMELHGNKFFYCESQTIPKKRTSSQTQIFSSSKKKEKEAVQKKTPQNPNWSRGSELIAMHKASFPNFQETFQRYQNPIFLIFFPREFCFSELWWSAAAGGARKKSKINFVGVSPVLWEVGGAQKRCLGSPGRKFGVFGPWLLASPGARLNLGEISAETGGGQNEGPGAATQME